MRAITLILTCALDGCAVRQAARGDVEPALGAILWAIVIVGALGILAVVLVAQMISEKLQKITSKLQTLIVTTDAIQAAAEDLAYPKPSNPAALEALRDELASRARARDERTPTCD